MYSSNGTGNPAALATPLAPAQSVQPSQPTLIPVNVQPAEPPAQVQPTAPTTLVQIPASIAEIEAACPGAPAEFVLAQVKAGATVQASQTAFIALLAQQLNHLQQPAPVPAPVPAPAAAPAAAQAPQQALPGVQPILPEPEETQWGGGGSPAQLWADLIEQEKQRLTQQAIITNRRYDQHSIHQSAVFAVDAKNPGLREAYLATLDPTPKRAPKPGQ